MFKKRTKYLAVGMLAAVMCLTSTSFVLAEETSLTITPPGGNKNVTVGTDVVINISTTGLTSPITYVSNDTHPGTTFISSNIDTNGVAKWKPTYDELGLHTITITANGANGASAVGTGQIIVNLPATSLTVGTLKPGSTVPAGSNISFPVTAIGFNYPSFVVTDNFPGSSIRSSNIGASGDFSWTPSTGDVGTHTITISARDFRGSTGSTVVTITVVTAGTYTAPAPSQIIPAVVTPPTTTNANKTVFTSSLTLGSRGSEVSALQKVLLSEGYYSEEITGYFGATTQSALKKYQSGHGLDPLGYVGPGTRAILNGGTVAGATTSLNPTPVAATSLLSSTERMVRIQSLRVVIQYLQAELNKLESLQ